jgi:membrane associated rhomboid family serine protease
LKDVPRYPVTAGAGLAAIVVTVLWWSGHGIEVFEANGKVWEKWELWRAFTSTLPHRDFFHIAFNLYWLWVFGALIERVYGHLKTAGIFALLALGSMLAEFAVSEGGVGLSGVGYGLWGMLWVMEKRDPRFSGAVDRRTSQTFVIWFFLCIVLTVTDVFPVANVAHGAGAVLGALLGWAATGTPSMKWKAIAALAILMILSLLGSTVFWPQVNLTSFAEEEIERIGIEALERGDNAYAAHCLETAVHIRHAPARAWYNLGVVYERERRVSEAYTCFERAATMPDADSNMRKVADDWKRWRGDAERLRSELERLRSSSLPVSKQDETNK